MTSQDTAAHSARRVRLICFAMPGEAAPFRRRSGPPAGVELVISGIGRTNAERAIRTALTRFQPASVFTCGFAGALAPELRAGTVVYTGDLTPAQTLILRQHDAQPARFHCAEQIAVTAIEKSALRRATGATAVEMESGWIQAECATAGVRCATIRVISDIADEDLPLDFNRLSRADRSLDMGRLLLAIARSPGRIPALMRLGRNSQRAAIQLGTVLRELLAADAAPR